MNNVFIYANGFVTRSILNNIKYLLNFDIERVILLRENHKADEPCFDNKIILFDSLDDCLNYCNSVIIIKDENTPCSKIDYIKNKCITDKKKYCEVDNPWTIDSLFVPDNITYDFDTFDFKNHPVVLDISVGMLSQQYSVEIMLSEIMYKNNVNFTQLFSEKTRQFLLQLDGYNYLNNNISNQLQKNYSGNDVFILSVNVGTEDGMRKYYNLFERIRPDYLILQIGNGNQEILGIQNAIQYGLFTPLDITIKTHNYYFANGNVILYCKEISYIDGHKTLDIEDPYLEEKLSFDILSKIGLPEGIIPL